MTRRERLQVLHSRTLRWGLGVSILFHAGVLAFVQYDLGPASEQTAQRSLAQVLERPKDTAVRLIDLSAAIRSESAKPNEVNGATPADIKVTTEELPTPASFSEAAMILAKLDIAQPVVPQPQIVPQTVDSGLTPIRIVRSGAIVFASEPTRRHGGGIRVHIGMGGDCPAGPTVHFPAIPALVNNQLPPIGGAQGTYGGSRGTH